MASLYRKAAFVAIFAVIVLATRTYMAGGWCYSNARLDGKVAIVTGANTGIGKETALDLARRGGRVVMACRSLERCNKAAEDIRKQEGVTGSLQVMHLNLSSLKSVRTFVAEFLKSESRLDMLINNAGVIGSSERQTTEDGFELMFGVNHLSHFLLTNLLLDTLKSSAPSRVVTVSSLAHATVDGLDFNDLMTEKDFGEWKAYGRSKLANILFSRELAKKLRGTGVTTYSLHPGTIRTEIGRNLAIFNLPVVRQAVYVLTWPFLKSADEGAQTNICCAVDEALATETGKYYSDCAEKEPYPPAQDDEAAKKLWDISAQLVGLK